MREMRASRAGRAPASRDKRQRTRWKEGPRVGGLSPAELSAPVSILCEAQYVADVVLQQGAILPEGPSLRGKTEDQLHPFSYLGRRSYAGCL
jgi:hypothetical protein